MEAKPTATSPKVSSTSVSQVATPPIFDITQSIAPPSRSAPLTLDGGRQLPRKINSLILAAGLAAPHESAPKKTRTRKKTRNVPLTDIKKLAIGAAVAGSDGNSVW